MNRIPGILDPILQSWPLLFSQFSSSLTCGTPHGPPELISPVSPLLSANTVTVFTGFILLVQFHYLVCFPANAPAPCPIPRNTFWTLSLKRTGVRLSCFLL